MKPPFFLPKCSILLVSKIQATKNSAFIHFLTYSFLANYILLIKIIRNYKITRQVKGVRPTKCYSFKQISMNNKGVFKRVVPYIY